MELHPTVLWAETKQYVFLTVELQDVKDLNVNLEENELSFEATQDNQVYKFHLNFPHPIDKDESQYSCKRNVQLKLVKKEQQRWRTLDKDGSKKHWLKCDWGKWVDSDEEDEKCDMGDFDMGGMNFGDGMGGLGGMGGMGGMGGLGGMGGMGGMGGLGGMGGGMGGMGEDFDSGSDDEEDLPDLEPLNEDNKKNDSCCGMTHNHNHELNEKSNDGMDVEEIDDSKNNEENKVISETPKEEVTAN